MNTTPVLPRTHTVLVRDRVKRIKVLPEWSQQLDRITRENSAFASFADLVNAKGNYRPSIYLGEKSRKLQGELLCLAIAYDCHQMRALDSRRVFRGDWELLMALPTLAQVRAKHVQNAGHFFDRYTMKMFGDAMRTFRVYRDGNRVYIERKKGHGSREYRWLYNALNGSLTAECNPNLNPQ